MVKCVVKIFNSRSENDHKASDVRFHRLYGARCCSSQNECNLKLKTLHNYNYFMKYVRGRNTHKDDIETRRYLVEDGIKPAIFGSYNYDPVKQKFEPHQYHVTESNNITAFTILSVIMNRMGTTTMSTPTDLPQGGHHGNHTDVYPTFVRANTDSPSSSKPFKAPARKGIHYTANSTTTQTDKMRSFRKKIKLEKREKEYNAKKNAVDLT